MKNKAIFRIAFISIMIFIVIATYFWYLYFKNHEGEALTENVRLEIASNGRVNYINAVPNDDPSRIPTYYFRVNNGSNDAIKYDVLLHKANLSDVSDGCSEATLFLDNELIYELKRDNKVVANGVISDIRNDLLYIASVDANSTDMYSLRVWLTDKAENSLSKHYHYIIDIKEK